MPSRMTGRALFVGLQKGKQSSSTVRCPLPSHDSSCGSSPSPTSSRPLLPSTPLMLAPPFQAQIHNARAALYGRRANLCLAQFAGSEDKLNER